MELRRYWSIVWRYRLVVLALPLIVGLAGSASFFVVPPGYSAIARAQLLLVPQQATAPDAFFRYDTYYTYLATEYAVDDLADVLNGNAFAFAVFDTLRGPDFGLDIRDYEVIGTFKARRSHRVLQLDVTTGDRARTLAITRAAVLTLQRDPLKYFTKGSLTAQQQAAVIPIDMPQVARSDRVSRGVNVALQTALALCAGIGLAFLLAYLNDRLGDAERVEEALGLPVLGAIPRVGRGA